MHWYVLTRSPYYAAILQFIMANKIPFEAHANRTRFWLPPGAVYTQFLLQWAEHCARVEEGF